MLYFIVAAIPKGFELENYLRLREMGDIFEEKEINLKMLKLIAQSVEASPYVMLSSTTWKNFEYFLKIIEDLGLVIESRKDHFSTASVDTDKAGHEQVFTKSVLICLNVANLADLPKYEKLLKKVVELEDYGASEDLVKDLKNS